MRNRISLPRMEGRVSRQAHTDLPEGTYERELGRGGFFGPAAHMYHTHKPTGWISFEGPLRPRAYDLNRLEATAPSPWGATAVFANAHVKIRIWRAVDRMDHLVRNADGDELLFVHAGAGDLFCDYGHLAFRDGDYVLLPRGTQWRIEVGEEGGRPMILLLTEARNDSYRLPEKGILGSHAIFDAAILDAPKIDDAFRAQQSEEPWRVVIKQRDALTTVTYPYNPLDAVGWKGDNAPVRLNWRDIRPLMSHRYHLPPSAHCTFVCDRFVVCTFCPRPIESDPGALKVPFFHSNEDFDEVIFYHQGRFFSRDNIRPGMVTFHPAGFPHGPHPKAFREGAEARRKETDEVAVMIDTLDPLETADLPAGVEWEGYVDSWKEGG